MILANWAIEFSKNTRTDVIPSAAIVLNHQVYERNLLSEKGRKLLGGYQKSVGKNRTVSMQITQTIVSKN